LNRTVVNQAQFDCNLLHLNINYKFLIPIERHARKNHHYISLFPSGKQELEKIISSLEGNDIALG